jgi:endosialidase-like protein
MTSPVLADAQSRHARLGSPNAFTDATDATSVSVASQTLAGGLGVAKAAFIGGKLTVTDTTATTSAATGSLHAAGGISSSGQIWAAGKVQSDAGFISNAGASFAASYNGTVVNGLDLTSTVSASSAWGVMRNTVGIVGTITTTNSTTAYNTSSDRRLKAGFEPMSDSGAVIDALNVYRFTWKVDGSAGAGVIAQEAYEVYPLAISRGDDNDAVDPEDAKSLWSADYSKFVPLLLAEMKALRVRVAALEAMQQN